MSIVSGLIDNTNVFKFKKIVVPTVGFDGDEVKPTFARDATRFRPFDPHVSYVDPALSVMGNPVQNLKNNGVASQYVGDINAVKLPLAVNNGDPISNKFDAMTKEYLDRVNNTPPLRMYNGAEFKLPAGFITR